ncbi:MAG: EAL domain-containing protein [Lysobacterales bacterium]|nr:EAL domain-containing protein [Xanthomonadales bacterium]MCB1612858.1 EAL domain-containing protein [Xanthomonadales bacterium]MCP5474574.1 EAL domain-containing protein [Rhodanobacteraceae bacterium]
MPDTVHNAGVLIVASNRDDRRVLFDSFDGAEFEAIYTARDVAQAHALLAQDPELALIFVEFLDPYAEAEGLCRLLAGHPRWRLVPRVGVLPAGALPPGAPGGPNAPVAAWVRSPINAAEAMRQARELIAPPAPVVDRSDAGWIEQLEVPALIVDVGNDKVRGVNQRACQLLRGDAEQITGSSARALIGHLPPVRDEGMGLGEGRIEAHGDPRLVGLATVGYGGSNGRLVLLTASPQAESPLEMLAAMARTGLDTQGVQPVLKRLIADYGLDFFYVCVERGGTEAEPQVMAAFPRTAQGALHAVWQTELYRRVLAGSEFNAAEDAVARLSEPFFKQLRLNSVQAVPLYGDGQRAFGALIAGGRKPQPRAPELLAVLRLVGSHLAMQSLVARFRSDSRFQGLHDSLTRLPNRLLFNDRLQSAIAEAGRSGELFAVLFVDLDRFKTINDSLGHSVGDQVLGAVAKRLRATVRASDTVSRYAGDEFTLILRHIVNREDVARIADKIVKVLETPLTLTDGRELQITASLGISFYPEDGKDGETLLKHADVAMYSAKGLGRNTYQVYVAVPEESHRQRLDLETKLRVAERNNELRAYYQPQVDAQTEDIIGMESLIRWEHPELGLISPGFFIPIAEDTGLIVPIGEWILRTACADAKRWLDMFDVPLRVSVNLSALQLRQPNLVEVVSRALQDTGLPGDNLDLEVTESINIKDIPNLMEVLGQLRELGCHIAIDDFGTGQSSLDYIKRFPADRIKIDQTFVRNIGVDPADEAIVRATINMARNMNRIVVAEGVETEDHLRFLREYGCQELQGYLFARPLPAASFENLLSERARLLAEMADE